MKSKKHVVFVGCSGFPYGLAEVQKITLISKALLSTGYHVSVICQKGFHLKQDYPLLDPVGIYESIKYVYTSGDPFRSNMFLKRNFLKVKGFFNELFLIGKRVRIGQLDYAFLSTNSFTAVLYYQILSKIFGFKTILTYVEFYSGIKYERFDVGNRLNSYLFDNYAPLLADGVLPISEFLIKHIERSSKNIKYLKVPILSDFDKFRKVDSIDSEKYFLFCGDAAYKEIILFIIDAFSKLESSTAFLYMVMNGDDKNLLEINRYIDENVMRKRIKVFSKLTSRQLFSLYSKAIGLLIPLRPTMQDEARFPHKIGEYLASGRPVISTNYGEVKSYFRDQVNMLIAEKYELKLFAEKMQFVLDNEQIANEIGANGRIFAEKNFDYRLYGEKISTFLGKLN